MKSLLQKIVILSVFMAPVLSAHAIVQPNARPAPRKIIGVQCSSDNTIEESVTIEFGSTFTMEDDKITISSKTFGLTNKEVRNAQVHLARCPARLADGQMLSCFRFTGKVGRKNLEGQLYSKGTVGYRLESKNDENDQDEDDVKNLRCSALYTLSR